MTATNDIVIYDFANSPCCRRVKIVLLEKGLEYKCEIVNLARMEQKSEAYLKINPNGLVPALSHNGRLMYESGVICDYLEDTFPQQHLYPKSDAARNQLYEWQNLELAMAKDYRTIMYAVVMGPLHHVACSLEEFLAKARLATNNPAHIAWEEKVWRLQVQGPQQQAEYRRRLHQYLMRVENALAASDYLVDNTYSLADIITYPRLHMFPIIGIPLSAKKHPNTMRWMGLMEQRPAFVATQTDEEKALLKLAASGVLTALQKAVYTPETQRSLVQRLMIKTLRPILRKKLGIDAVATLDSTREFAQSDKTENSVAAVGLPPSLLSMTAARREALVEGGGDSLTLYGSPLCPLTDRLKLLLKQMGMSYRYVEIDLINGEQRSAEFMRLNPCGEVPVLCDGETRIVDSMRIAEYLAGGDEGLDLIRADIQELLDIRLWNAFDMGMHKEFQPFFMAELAARQQREMAIDTSVYDKAQAVSVLTEKLAQLDAKLGDRDWVLQRGFSYADLLLYTRLDSFAKLGLDECLASYSALRSWMARCADRLAENEKLDIASEEITS